MIIRLAKIELMKMRRKMFYILPLVIVAHVILLCFIEIEFPRATGNVLSAYQEFNVYMLMFYRSLTIPAAFFIIYQTGHEFENRIVQKGITLGITRQYYFLSRLIYCFFVSFIFVLLFLILALFFIQVRHYFSGISFVDLVIAGLQVGMAAFCMCVVLLLFIVLVKEVKKAVIFFIGYIFAEFILLTIASRLFDISLILPFQSLKNIVLDHDTYHYVWQNPPITLFLILAYPIVFITASYYHLRRTDLPAF